MTRNVFDALVKLFAISVNRNPDSDKSKIKAHFKSFLTDFLEPKYIESFLLLFDNYLTEYSSQESQKKLSLNSVKLISFCEDTANKLSEKDRAIIIFNLIRLITETGKLKDSEEFIRLVADIYMISNNRIDDLLSFFYIENDIQTIKLDSNNLVFAEAICFCDDVYALKNTSAESFFIDTVLVKKSAYCYALKESVLTFNDQTKVFFNDYISQFDYGKTNKFNIFLKDVSVSRKHKKILHNTSIKLSSGDFIGVIGNSGSGKTSLLNAISGIDRSVGGAFYTDLEKKLFNYSYQTQDYQFVPMFTVEEHLNQRADFLQIDKKKKKEKVRQVAESVGLDNHLNKIVTKIDNSSFQISGGQQKRLRIAMELLSLPDVFILDEPTSGLSSEDSFKILSLLKNISKKNKLVISSVHQPDYDSLLLFDKIIVLDINGYIAYYGNPSKVTEYLRNVTESVDKSTTLELSKNPSAILNLLDVPKISSVNSNFKDDFWYVKFKSSEMWLEEEFDEANKFNPGNKIKLNPIMSLFSNILFDLKTGSKNIIRVIMLFLIPLMTGIVFAIIARYSQTETYHFYQNPNIPVWILITIITAIFIGMVSSGNEFISLSRYHLSDFYLKNKFLSLSISKFLKYIAISFFQATLLVIPACYILEMSFILSKLFLIIWILCFLGAITGMLVSLLFKSSSVVYLIIPFIIVLNMIFSGVLIKFDSFNNKLFCNNPANVSKIANLMIAFPATNALISEIYLFDDKQSNSFEKKVMFYEASYYIDYFLPVLSDIYNQDSLLAKDILKSEKSRNSEFPKVKNDVLFSINQVKNYYQNQKKNILNNFNPQKKNAKFCNKNVDFVVNTYYKENIVLCDRKIDRQFMIAFIPPYYKIDNVVFKPYVQIGNQSFELYFYTIIKLIFFSCILFILTLLLKNRYR